MAHNDYFNIGFRRVQAKELIVEIIEKLIDQKIIITEDKK